MNTSTSEIEPTDEEAKNGWNTETLTKYINERLNAEYPKPKSQTKTDSHYDPHRW